MKEMKIESYKDYAEYGYWENGYWIPENPDDTYVINNLYVSPINMKANRIIIENGVEEIPYECIRNCRFVEIHGGGIYILYEDHPSVFLDLNSTKVDGMIHPNHKYHGCFLSDTSCRFWAGSCPEGDALLIEECPNIGEEIFKRFSGFKRRLSLTLERYCEVRNWGGLSANKIITDATVKVDSWDGLSANMVMVAGVEKSIFQLKSEEVAKKISEEYIRMNVHNLTESYRVWSEIDPDKYGTDKAYKAGERFRLLEM